MRLFLFLFLLAPAAVAQTKTLDDKVMAPEFDAGPLLRRCRRAHHITAPVTITITWVDVTKTAHIERVEVCPLCYKKMLEKEAGY